jgi:hypothetical protein
MGEMKNSCKILAGSLKGREHSEDLDIDWKILERILENSCGKVWTECIGLRIRTSDWLL